MPYRTPIPIPAAARFTAVTRAGAPGASNFVAPHFYSGGNAARTRRQCRDVWARRKHRNIRAWKRGRALAGAHNWGWYHTQNWWHPDRFRHDHDFFGHDHAFGFFGGFGYPGYYTPFWFPGWYKYYGWPYYSDYGYYGPDYGYGYGYAPTYGYVSQPTYGYDNGVANGYDNGLSYGDNNAPAFESGYSPAVTESASAQPATNTTAAPTGEAYAAEAVEAFQHGDYHNALLLANHAAVDMPRDPKVHQMMSQALFALKDYRGAAIEAHVALELGLVIDWPTLYAFYGNIDAYTSQLRALETYVRDNPKAPEGHLRWPIST